MFGISNMQAGWPHITASAQYGAMRSPYYPQLNIWRAVPVILLVEIHMGGLGGHIIGSRTYGGLQPPYCRQPTLWSERTVT